MALQPVLVEPSVTRLSGRTYVYQAMRVTGAADPTVSVKETLKGKLPQKKLVRGAAHGYSSYGNQIGLATGYVKEIYHPDYVAKRMEIGAVMGAAPRKAVKDVNILIREISSSFLADVPDVMVLVVRLVHPRYTPKLPLKSAAQKFRREMHLQSGRFSVLFRRPEVSKLIKKCNDFGAGGVSVAIGELAHGTSDQPGQGSEKICRSGWYRNCHLRISGAYGSGGRSGRCKRVLTVCK